MLDLSAAEQEGLFDEALRISKEANDAGDPLREWSANTAAWLLSYTPSSAIAQLEPLFYELMLHYGRLLMEALNAPA